MYQYSLPAEQILPADSVSSSSREQAVIYGNKFVNRLQILPTLVLHNWLTSDAYTHISTCKHACEDYMVVMGHACW